MKELFNLEAEQLVIGGLLIDPKKFDDLADIITESEFYDSRHQLIYRAIGSMVMGSDAVDVVTVSEQLSGSGDLDQAGGFAYVAQLAMDIPSTTNLVAYARVIETKATERRLLSAGQHVADIAMSDIPLDEKINEAQSAVMNLEAEAEEAATHASESMQELIGQWQERLDNQGRLNGLSTGLALLDERTNGLQGPDLLILAARPSMGKTTLAMNIAEQVAVRDQKPVLVFSLEMSKVQLLDRLTASVGKIPFSQLRDGSVFASSEQECKLHPTASKIKNSKLYIDDRSGLHINQIRSTARKLHRKVGLELIVVDYIQLAHATAQSREQEISQISGGLKALAKDLNVPVIALSQLSRKCEERQNKRPISSDLRESGAIEQDADMIMFLYRDEVYNPDSPSRGVTELITSKLRNGETGVDYVASRLDICRFDTMATEYIPMEIEPPRKRGMNY